MTERRKDYMDLDRLYGSIEEIKISQATMMADMAYVKQSIDRHNHLIDGNGKKGCVDRITTIENMMTEVKNRFVGINWIFALAVTVLIACFEIVWRNIK